MKKTKKLWLLSSAGIALFFAAYFLQADSDAGKINPGLAATSTTSSTDEESGRIDQLQRTLERLQQENEHLRSENRQLRRLLAELKSEPAAENVEIPEASVEASREAVGLTHWLTTSSGKRHNNRCRYYKTSAGRPCGPNEGTPCKICGG